MTPVRLGLYIITRMIKGQLLAGKLWLSYFMLKVGQCIDAGYDMAWESGTGCSKGAAAHHGRRGAVLASTLLMRRACPAAWQADVTSPSGQYRQIAAHVARHAGTQSDSNHAVRVWNPPCR